MFFRKILLGLLVVGMFLSFFSIGVLAVYPEKDITLFVHVSPGGTTDLTARTIAKHMEKRLGVNIVLKYLPGAGGSIAYTALALSPPDGYTMGTTNTMSFVTNEINTEGLAYTLKDSFTPIAQVVFDPSGIVVPADSPFKTLDDLIKAAKENPGTISWGGTMLGGAHHIHALILEREAGIKLNYIPFDGLSEIKTAILGGHIDVGASGMSGWTELINEGKLRSLAFAGINRIPLLPDVPTYTELGYAVQTGSNRGYSVASGTPKEIVDLLTNTIKEVLESPEFLAEAEKLGIAHTLDYLSGADYYAYLIKLQGNMREFLKTSD